MAKIAFIGAGSLGFTRGLVRDLLTFPLLENSTIALMDINKERLDFARRAVEKIVQLGNYPAKVVATLDRKTALKGANAVLSTILDGGVPVWRSDLEIPAKYGIHQNVGDTRGPGGVFRFLRTVPIMLDICRDIEKYCPDAIFLNYTNPMALLCRAMQKATKVKVTGLCHSVQGTAHMLADWIGTTMDRITYLCGGINHQSWFLEYKKDGRDAYPLIRKVVQKKEIYEIDPVRIEMFLHLDYYVTESSHHNAEYNWWFLKRPDLRNRFAKQHGVRNRIKMFQKRDAMWRKDAKVWLSQKEPIALKRGAEYAANIINAYLGGDKFIFNGNVPNMGLIPNLPQDVCVEAPVLADRRGFNSMYVGPLPPQCAALNNVSVVVEEMAVTATLTGDPRLVFHALTYDPLTASVLSMAEIKRMVSEMLTHNHERLPQFKSIKI